MKKTNTIIVTGGAGFIGSHLTDKLIEKGERVVVIDNLSTGSRENLNPKAVFYKANIEDAEISNIFEKENPSAVFHFAAQINLRSSIDDPIRDAKTNILGSLNVLENCSKYGVKKVVFSSTGGAMYGAAKIPTAETALANPSSPYGIAKLSVEYYLQYYLKSLKLPFVVLRFANVYGPRQNHKGEAGVVAIFCNAMINGKQPIIFGSGKQTRDFVYVGDAVESAVLAYKKNEFFYVIFVFGHNHPLRPHNEQTPVGAVVVKGSVVKKHLPLYAILEFGMPRHETRR